MELYGVFVSDYKSEDGYSPARLLHDLGVYRKKEDVEFMCPDLRKLKKFGRDENQYQRVFVGKVNVVK